MESRQRARRVPPVAWTTGLVLLLGASPVAQVAVERGMRGPFRLSGRLVTDADTRLVSAVMTLVSSTPGAIRPSLIPDRVFPNGAFFFLGVPSGTYILSATARLEGVGGEQCGSATIDVDDRHLSDLELRLRACAVLTGRTRFEAPDGSPPGDPTAVIVTARAVGEGPQGVIPARVAEGGHFQIGSVTPGQYLIDVLTVPAGWRLQGVYRGEREVGSSPVDLAPGARVEDLVLVFAREGPERRRDQARRAGPHR